MQESLRMLLRTVRDSREPGRGTNPNRRAYCPCQSSPAPEGSGVERPDSTYRAAASPFIEPLAVSLGVLRVARTFCGRFPLQRHLPVGFGLLSGARVGSGELVMSGRISGLHLHITA